ncbi:MAG: phenylalanine--tRNA ligase subunit beta [Saprospirales bacterium]|nr:phenylalanine--tRNA ligase subunit beta [Saprospirales bacterium]
MKISLNWLKQYLDLDLEPEKIGEILTDIGLELEGMETVESIPGGLEGLVVGQVVECERHPNADRLSLCRVDIGGESLLQIVCGAPNVAAGQKVVVAQVGTTLHPIEGDPFTLKKGKIRGEESEGMICAEDEVGMGHDHAGIMVLKPDTPVGISAGEYFQIERDIVFEIGLTPNRSDATCHLGVARDLAAALKINYGHSGVLRLPVIDSFQPDNNALSVKVIVENPEACPRYSGVSIQGIKVGESPEWLKNRLKAIGLRPINNVVDITNYVLHEYGQPLHAFDLAAIKGHTVRVKTLAEGTPFASLDEQERKLSDQDLIICDGNSEAMCIGGVFGGLHSGVTETTQDVFLESAHFNPKWIRRTSMQHNLRTDAAKVFEKGSDPNITVEALKRATLMIREIAGGKIASEIVDIYPTPIAPVEITVDFEYINKLIGVAIPREEVRAIFESLGMREIGEKDGAVTLAIPTNKVDVTRPADVVEEVLRIYGLNKVAIPAQLRTSLSYGVYPDPRQVASTIAGYLASNGCNEIMAVSLTESKYFRDLLPIPEAELVYINNTSNVQLDIMRPSMLFSGLEAVVQNQNRQQPNLKLFEFGNTYRKTEGGFEEKKHLSLFLTGQRLPENWLQPDSKDVDYYTLRAWVDNILARMGVTGYQEMEHKDAVLAYGMQYRRGAVTLVSFGQVDRSILRGMDIKNPVYYADFEWSALEQTLKKHKIGFEELNRFPSVRRDLALVVDNSIKFGEIASIARKTGKKTLRTVNLFDVYENETQLGKGKKSYAVSFLFEDPTKTLQDKEVDQVMDQLIQAYESQLHAHIRR